jgi:hypothetical protein
MVEMPGGAIAVASDRTGFDLTRGPSRDHRIAGRALRELGTASTSGNGGAGRRIAELSKDSFS